MAHRPANTFFRRTILVSGAVLCLLVPAAEAQIALPGVRVPDLVPGVDVNQTVTQAQGAVGRTPLADLRQLRVQELLRTERARVESGPRGMPIIRSEVVAFSPTPDALAAAEAAGFTVVRERPLDGLDATLVILQGPAGWSTRRALRRLRALDPEGAYDYNHVYFESGAVAESAVQPAAPRAEGTVQSGARVGLIDGGVADHAALAGAQVHRHGCGDAVIPSAHGTAVASLLIGHSGDFHGAAPGAELFAADVYCGAPTGGAVDAVAEAFGWLSRERVPVINVSLVGPDNMILKSVVQRMLARGHLIVAAVGNDGPSAAALYPASYPGVIGVTGVDGKQKVLLEAARGKQVDFAAPGADMAAATIDQTFTTVRGTSFAAPIVAGLLARSLLAPDAKACAAALESLSAKALDLGPRGPDRTYGNGLVGQDVRVVPRLAGAQ